MSSDSPGSKDLDPTRTSMEREEGTPRGPADPASPSSAPPSSPHAPSPFTASSSAPASNAGGHPAAIGAYRIIGVLGEGGMGIVYEAEQAMPRRAVALKVNRGGPFVDEQRLRMFQREAETLARLKHPNIAAIYESGRTDDGQHYFAMELVSGPTLDRFLKGPIRSRSDVERRLELFRTICDAVQYAHQRGVIHRDLKPSNIVVTEESGRPAVKVLDFGLARITESDVAATTTTNVGAIQGTLAYMSPEQALGRPEDVDVRSDVYSLGMIVYEMLLGRRPYDLVDRTISDALRVICESAPRPLREGWPGEVRLDSDLETIVGKALEKDKDRRYQAASALGDDIGRYLASQPILARAPSTAYQLRKAISRNKGLFALACALALSLAASTVWMSVLYARAGRERAEAERQAQIAQAVNHFLNDDLLAATDPSRTPDRDIKMRTVLETASKRIEKGFEGEPLVAASVRRTLGRTFGAIGVMDEAERHLRAAIETYRVTNGPGSVEELRTLIELGNVAYSAGNPDETETIIRPAVEELERALGDTSPDTIRATGLLALAVYDQGKLDEAEALGRRVLASGLRGLGEKADETLEAMNTVAMVDTDRGKYEEAEALYQRVLRIQREKGGPDTPFVMMTLNNLGQLYLSQDRLADAERVTEDALARCRRVLGDEHNLTLTCINTLAVIERRMKHMDKAEPLYREAYETSRRTLGETSVSTILPLVNLARFYQAAGRCDSERAYIERAVAVCKEHAPAESSVLATALRIQGECCIARGDLAAAEAPLVDSERRFSKLFPGDESKLHDLREEIATLYERLGRPDSAAAWRAKGGHPGGAGEGAKHGP